jgi:hypothetical protein
MVCKIFINNGLVYTSEAYEVREQWSLATDVIHQYIDDNIGIGVGEMCVNPEEFKETIKRYCHANSLDLAKVPNSIKALNDALEKFEIYYTRVTTECGKQYVYVIPGRWNIDAKFICSSIQRRTRQTGLGVSSN